MNRFEHCEVSYNAYRYNLYGCPLVAVTCNLKKISLSILTSLTVDHPRVVRLLVWPTSWVGLGRVGSTTAKALKI